MRQTMRRVAGLALVAGMLGGCPPAARELTEPNELAVVQAAEVARVDYEFYLEVLRDQMKAGGDLRKQIWAERELENLIEAHDLTWGGLGEITPPQRSALAKTDEPLLVEYVVTARRKYLKAMDDLLSLYQSTQDRPNVERIQDVLDAFNPIHTYMYYLSAEIPSDDLRATEPVLQATDLFDKGLAACRATRMLWVRGGDAQIKHVAALKNFTEVIEKYPKSNKISRSAFFIAEINRTYGEYERAAQWYDRAWQWDPKTSDPARFRAATLYDFKLKDTETALKYYRLSLKHDRNRDNIVYARERIRYLRRK